MLRCFGALHGIFYERWLQIYDATKNGHLVKWFGCMDYSFYMQFFWPGRFGLFNFQARPMQTSIESESYERKSHHQFPSWHFVADAPCIFAYSMDYSCLAFSVIISLLHRLAGDSVNVWYISRQVIHHSSQVKQIHIQYRYTELLRTPDIHHQLHLRHLLNLVTIIYLWSREPFLYFLLDKKVAHNLKPTELWCLSGGKRGDYQNCSVLYCVLMLCTVISTLRWAVLTVLRIGFCHTGPISLCLDSFVFICVYFVCFCLMPHSCIIVSMVGWTWWDWSLILRTYLPSVHWHCWLGYLTRPQYDL